LVGSRLEVVGSIKLTEKQVETENRVTGSFQTGKLYYFHLLTKKN